MRRMCDRVYNEHIVLVVEMVVPRRVVDSVIRAFGRQHDPPVLHEPLLKRPCLEHENKDNSNKC